MKRFLISLCLAGLLAIFSSRSQAAPGDLDVGFNSSATGGAERVNVVLVQPDGKILVAGHFSHINGTARANLARLNSDGTLETAFNPGTDGEVNALALDSGGRIVLGGNFANVGGQARSNLARLEADGVVDTSFNPSPNGEIFSIAVQPDDAVLFSGNFVTVGATGRERFARVDENGVVDATFAPTFSGGTFGVARVIRLLPDGRILAGGDFGTVNGSPRSQLVRLNSNGTTDGTFTGACSGGAVFDLVVQTDGKILIGGFFNTVNGVASGRLRRLEANGQTDGDFTANIEDGGVRKILLQDDGKVIAMGTFAVIANAMARFLPDGTHEFSYDPSVTPGFVLTGVLLADGRALIGGTFTQVSATNRDRLARIESDGGLDVGFNPDAEEDSEVEAIAPRGDGNLLVGGAFQTMGGQARGFGAEVTSGGALLPFNPQANGTIHCLLVQRDGRIVIGGNFTTVANGQPRPRLARFFANGTLDSAFNPAPDDEVSAIAETGDGDLYVGGKFLNIAGGARQRLARLNADGSLDTGFANPAADAPVASLAVQPDGLLLAGGQFVSIAGSASARLARLRADGTLDPAFLPPGAGGAVNAVALQSDGKILIGGQFATVGASSRLRIARLESNGVVDLSFQADADSSVRGISVQTDGRIIVSGSFTTVNGSDRDFIAQLDEDGTVDGEFETVPNGTIESHLLNADGSVIIGGFFNNVDAVTRRSLARLVNDPATQVLTFPDRDRIEWLRGGASPETHEVVFELSTDGGTTFTEMGDGSRIAGGWELEGIALPDTGIVRARARVRGGLSNGSSGWVTSTRLYQFTPLSAPVLTIKGKKKILTSAPKVTVKGTASDVDGDLVSVRFLDSRPRGRAFRAVRGLAAWSAKAVLKDGRNKVLVEARDASGRKTLKSVTILKK